MLQSSAQLDVTTCGKYSPRTTIGMDTRWVLGDVLEKFQCLDPAHPEEVLGAISGWKEPESHYRPGWALTGHQQEAAPCAHSSSYSGSFIAPLFKVVIFFSPSNPFSRSILCDFLKPVGSWKFSHYPNSTMSRQSPIVRSDA